MSHLTVFLVDGFADEREMYAEYLALKGFDVQAFEDPRPAVDALRSAAPDAIVTRIRQTKSGIDGMALATIVRHESRTRDAAIVAITSSILPADHDAALRAGCDACLMLPITPDELVRVLRSAVRSRRSAEASSRVRP